MSVTLTALLLSSLGGTPSWSASVVRRVGLEADAGLDLAETLALVVQDDPKAAGHWVPARAFAAAVAFEKPDAAACAGSLDCAAELGRAGGIDLLLALQVVRVGSRLVLDVTLIDTNQGTAIAAASTTTSIRFPPEDLQKLASALLARVKARDAVTAETAIDDHPAPVVADLERPRETSEEPANAAAVSDHGLAQQVPNSVGTLQSGALAGAMALSDLSDKPHPSFGIEIFGGYHIQAFDLSARRRFGAQTGFGLAGTYSRHFAEVDGFAGARLDGYPGASVAGAGLMIGARRSLEAGFGVLASLSGEGFLVGSSGFRPFAVVLSAGVDWRR